MKRTRNHALGSLPAYPLFHGTGIYPLAAIVASDSLLEGTHWGRKGEPRGPRLARNAGFAASFILNSMHWGEGGMLILDGERLQADYVLKPFLDTDMDGEPWPDGEEEIVAVTPSVENLHRYLVAVACDPAIIRLAMDQQLMQNAIDECGWPFDSFIDESEFVIARRALENLLEHPLLNVWVPEGGLTRTGNWDINPYVEAETVI